MTTQIGRMNSLTRMAATSVILPASTQGIWKRMLTRLGSRVRLNEEVNPHDFMKPDTQRTYLSFHRMNW